MITIDSDSDDVDSASSYPSEVALQPQELRQQVVNLTQEEGRQDELQEEAEERLIGAL